MSYVPEEYDADDGAPVKGKDLLSFKVTGRLIELGGMEAEFRLMQDELTKPLTAEIAERVCNKSGTHLLKLVSPRVDGGHAVLRFSPAAVNRRAAFLPSTNAPDIPFCKLLFRPLEVVGHASHSVVDHILNPEAHSVIVLQAFSAVFGEDVLQAMRSSLLGVPPVPLELGAGEFPVIFIPRPGGGDLQVTPVSPAHVFMGMKQVAQPYFKKAQHDGPRPLRGRWMRQAVSAKPQNISGAIGGPRLRFLATMPPGMKQREAELHRYVRGGSFPRWRDEDVTHWVLRYAQMLEADASYNNSNTRAALDDRASRLIRDAEQFIAETVHEAGRLASLFELSPGDVPVPPGPAEVLMRRFWGSDDNRDIARKALTSPHFEHCLGKNSGGQS